MADMTIKKVDAPYVIDMNPAGPFDCAAAINAAIAAQAAAEAAQKAAEQAGALDPTLVALSNLDGTLGLVEQIGDDLFTKRPLGVLHPTDVPTVADGDLRWLGYDPGLAAIAALDPVADTFAYFTSPTTAALTPITAFGRSILSAVDAPALGPIIGLGSAAYEDIGVIGATIPLLSNANTWGARQDIRVTHAGVAFQIYSSDSGALDGPVMALSRDSTSPVANDFLGSLYAYGRTVSGDLAALYSTITTQIVSAADTPNFVGRVIISTAVAGSSVPLAAASFENTSVVIGSAAGGAKGDSSLNAKTLYEAGVLLSAKYGLLAGTNLWTAVNTFKAGSVHGGTTTPNRAASFSSDGVLSLRYGNNAIVIPLAIINQNAPAATAYQAGLEFRHGVGEFIGSRIVSVPLTDFATAGTAQATLNLQYTNASGVLANGLVVGLGVAVGTVALQGVNTLNAFAIYENSVLLTSKYGQLAVNNNWTGVQTVNVTAGGTVQQWIGSNDTTTATQLLIRHARATPTNADPLGIIYFQGNNSALSNFNYALFSGLALNVAAGAESGQFTFTTYSAGVAAVRMDIRAGVLFGNPAGGDKGTGTINVQNGIYENNVLISTKYVIGTLSTDGTLAANLDTNVPSQKAVKTYVDTVVAGFHYTDSVRVATTAAGTLASSFENGDTVDGVVLATGNRILIKDQAAQTENGIYIVNASGAPTRATDADTGAELKGIACLVTAGTVNINSQWSNSNTTTITIGTTNVTFAQIGAGATAYAAGFGLSLTGVTFAVADPELVALANLTSGPDQVPYFTGSGAAALMTATSFSRGLFANTTQGAWQTALGLAIGTNVQAYDATLAGLAAMPATVGLVAQTSTDVFGIRLIGVANATDIPDRAAGDGRWLPQTSYTAADVLAKLITVDGTGSLLDADFLDGQSGAYYLAWANFTGVPATFAPSAHTHPWSDITATPTTLAGYGITDAAPLVHTHTFASLTSKPTTLAGYGITDAAPLASPPLTGIPTAPTAAPGTNTTQLATTAFVTSAISTAGGGYQPLDSDLSAIAALTTQPFGRSLLTSVDAAAARGLLILGTAAVQNIGTSGANVPLMSTANTWSTTQTISATNPVLALTKSASGGIGGLDFNTGSFIHWRVASNQTAETGSNAGSDFELRAYSDTGTYLYSPFTAKRSTGVVDFSAIPTVNGEAVLTSENTAYIYASQEGVTEDDGVTDMRPTFEAALNKAILANKTLIVDVNNVRFSSSMGITATKDKNIRIVCPAFTRFIVGPNAPPAHQTTAVRVATTVNGTLATAFANGQTVDGVVLATGNRILIKNQTLPKENGIYTVNASGAPTRATDADTGAELPGIACYVSAGLTQAGDQWICSNLTAPVIGTDAINFAKPVEGPYIGVGGTEIVGPTSFDWVVETGVRTLTPYTDLAVDVKPGWNVKLTKMDDVQVGDFIKLVSHQLCTGEHRNSDYRGELNRIRAINPDGTVELDEKLAQGYTAGTLHTTTVAGSRIQASTSYNNTIQWVTLTALSGTLTADQMIGLRFTIAGVVRQVVYFNAATKEVGFNTTGSHPQAVYGAAPTLGATITFDAKTYIHLYKPVKIWIEGAMFETVPGWVYRGFSISYGDEPVVRDCATINFQKRGLSATSCFRPEFDFNRTDRCNWENLGYGILFLDCRAVRVLMPRAANCRRMFDCGGSTQTIGLVALGGRVTGGYKSAGTSETVWDGVGADYNYGIGDHGQSKDWVYDGTVIEDVQTGCIFRGANMTVRNVTFQGVIEYCFIAAGGDGLSIFNCDYNDGRPAADLNPVTPPSMLTETTPTLISVVAAEYSSDTHFTGKLIVDGFRFRGIKCGIAVVTNGEMISSQREWFIRGMSGHFAPDVGNTFLGKALSRTVASVDDGGWSFFPKNFTTLDCDVMSDDPHSGFAWILRDTWMRIGRNKFRFHMSEGTILEFPVTGGITTFDVSAGRIMRVQLQPATLLRSNYRCDMIIARDAGGGSGTPTAEYIPSVNVKMWDPANIGTTDPAGSINVGWNSSKVTMCNRLGSGSAYEIQGVVEFDL